MTSKVIKGRACPKWLSPLTVGPQTYMPTKGGFKGVNVSFRLVKLLKTFKDIIQNFAKLQKNKD